MAEQGENIVPTTWPELLAQQRPLVEESLEIVRELPAELAEPDPFWPAADSFGGIDSTLAAVAAIFGPDRCGPYLELLGGFIPGAVAEIDSLGLEPDNLLPALYLLSYLNVARCCGSPVPDEAVTAESGWLPRYAAHLDRFDENERQTLGFAALAAGLPDLVPAFVGGGRLAARFQPGEVFDFNTHGFIRYLAGAVHAHADFSDVEPAWLNFVARFPHKRAAGTLDWRELVWAARAVLAGFGAVPLENVAAELHRQVAT